MPVVPLPPARLFALRASPGERGWGGSSALLNLGAGEAALAALTEAIGPEAALRLHLGAVSGFGQLVHDIDAEAFESLGQTGLRGRGGRRRRSAGFTATCWRSSRPRPASRGPRIRRSSSRRPRGRWRAAGTRPRRACCARPAARPRRPGSGSSCRRWRWRSAPGRAAPATCSSSTAAPAPGPRAAASGRSASAARPGPRGRAGLEALPARTRDALSAAARRATVGLGDAVRIDFVVENDRPSIVDVAPVRRSGRAAVKIVVDLANVGAIGRDEALLRIEPRSLVEHLHPQIDPAAPRDVFGTGVAASPGAATGRIVFSSEAAQAAAAQDEATILVRPETTPEDIRGMHVARGVLTMRGGMTSHAAVIARGLGLPCVVGAGDLRLDPAAGTLTSADGRVFHEGALITIDGTRGAGDGRRAGDDPARARRRLLRAARLGRRGARPRGAGERRHPGRGADGAGLRGRRARALPHRAHVLRRGADHGDARDDPRRHATPSGRRRSTSCCRCSATTSSSCSRSCTGCR